MINDDKDPVPGQDETTEKITPDEKTTMKVHQHLSDINDVISDQDIKNVNTDFNEEGAKELEQKDSSGEEKNDNEDDKDKEEKKDKNEAIPIVTPWNILGG